MSITNEVRIIGRLTADPIVRNDGKARALFTVAVDRYAKKGEEKKADFFPCIAWENKVNYVAYMHKGDMVAVTGGINTYEAVNQKTGVNEHKWNVVVESSRILVKSQKPEEKEKEYSGMNWNDDSAPL